MLLNHKKGQSTLEYALLIAAVIAGLVMMQMQIKRGIAGRLKSATDEIGEQYDPTKFESSYTTVSSSRRQDTVKGQVTESKLLEDETVSRSGSESVSAWVEKEGIYDNL